MIAIVRNVFELWHQKSIFSRGVFAKNAIYSVSFKPYLNNDASFYTIEVVVRELSQLSHCSFCPKLLFLWSLSSEMCSNFDIKKSIFSGDLFATKVTDSSSHEYFLNNDASFFTNELVVCVLFQSSHCSFRPNSK